MADTKTPNEPTFPTKRKLEPTLQDQEQNPPNKSHKLQSTESLENHHVLETSPEENTVKETEPAFYGGEEEEEEEDDDDEEEEDYENNDDDEDEEGGENGDADVDRKGKGIMRDDKGKGKLIEEEEEEESDESDGGGSQSEGDSDLSDDPLAEVDLDNILPSRTRRRVVQPGVYISTNKNENHHEDDDSDA